MPCVLCAVIHLWIIIGFLTEVLFVAATLFADRVGLPLWTINLHNNNAQSHRHCHNVHQLNDLHLHYTTCTLHTHDLFIVVWSSLVLVFVLLKSVSKLWNVMTSSCACFRVTCSCKNSCFFRSNFEVPHPFWIWAEGRGASFRSEFRASEQSNRSAKQVFRVAIELFPFSINRNRN